MQPVDLTVELKDFFGDKPAEKALMPDLEMEMLAAQARDLLARAGATLNAAYANLAEAPDDVADAAAAVAVAKETETRISAMAKDRTRGHDARGLANTMLSNTSACLNQAAAEVDAHEAGNSCESAKRTAHQASLNAKEAAKHKVKTVEAKHSPKKKPLFDDDEDDAPGSRLKQQRQARQAGENDGNDERDNYVGKGKYRRPRKATSEYGRKATRVLGGVMGEDVADEIVSTAGTGAQRMTEGATGIMTGDVKASDRGAKSTARGVRNVLRDDLGLDAEFSETVGRTTGVVLKQAGRGAIVVRDTAVGATKYVGDKADDARDLAADNYHKMWKFGRELNQLIGGLQANAKTRAMYDTDKDGKVELHEVVGVLGRYGIKDMKNVDFNGDGNITYAEIGAAIKSRGKPPAKH